MATDAVKKVIFANDDNAAIDRALVAHGIAILPGVRRTSENRYETLPRDSVMSPFSNEHATLGAYFDGDEDEDNRVVHVAATTESPTQVHVILGSHKQPFQTALRRNRAYRNVFAQDVGKVQVDRDPAMLYEKLVTLDIPPQSFIIMHPRLFRAIDDPDGTVLFWMSEEDTDASVESVDPPRDPLQPTREPRQAPGDMPQCCEDLERVLQRALQSENIDVPAHALVQRLCRNLLRPAAQGDYDDAQLEAFNTSLATLEERIREGDDPGVSAVLAVLMHMLVFNRPRQCERIVRLLESMFPEPEEHIDTDKPDENKHFYIVPAIDLPAEKDADDVTQVRLIEEQWKFVMLQMFERLQEWNRLQLLPSPGTNTQQQYRRNMLLLLRDFNIMQPNYFLTNQCEVAAAAGDDPGSQEALRRLMRSKFAPPRDVWPMASLSPAQRVIQLIMNPLMPGGGYLAHHEVGTGKTCAALAAAGMHYAYRKYVLNNLPKRQLKKDEQLRPFIWVTRASLKDNPFTKRVEYQCFAPFFTDTDQLRSQFWVASYKSFSNWASRQRLNGDRDPLRGRFIIVDEAHNLFSQESLVPQERPDTAAIERVIKHSHRVSGNESVKVLLLTATPEKGNVYNVSRMARLLLRDANRVAQIPTTKNAFNARYTGTEEQTRQRFLEDYWGLVSFNTPVQDVGRFATTEEPKRGTLWEEGTKRMAEKMGFMDRVLFGPVEPEWYYGGAIDEAIRDRLEITQEEAAEHLWGTNKRQATKKKKETQQDYTDRKRAGVQELVALLREAAAPANAENEEVQERARKGIYAKLNKLLRERKKEPMKKPRKKATKPRKQTKATCIGKDDPRKRSECLRNRANQVLYPTGLPGPYQMGNYNQFDAAAVVASVASVDDSISPKLEVLLRNIRRLDTQDRKQFDGKTFKHMIYSDLRGHFGARLIGAALLAHGYCWKRQRLKRLSVDEVREMRAEVRRGERDPDDVPKRYSLQWEEVTLNTLGQRDRAREASDQYDESKAVSRKRNFIVLTDQAFESGESAFSAAQLEDIRPQVKRYFNDREHNAHGEEARIVVLDQKFKEGIDLYDVRHVHLFEPLLTKGDDRQVIGRALRFCGSTKLPWQPGWKVKVHRYGVQFDSVNEGRVLRPATWAKREFRRHVGPSAMDADRMRALLQESAIDGILFQESIRPLLPTVKMDAETALNHFRHRDDDHSRRTGAMGLPAPSPIQSSMYDRLLREVVVDRASGGDISNGGGN